MPEKKGPVAFLAGGISGACEISCTMPLDTIKTQMQLKSRGGVSMGALATTKDILQLKGVPGLYYGMSAMMAQVSAKAAIRFCAYEYFRGILGSALGPERKAQASFAAGMCAGITEAAVWVTPTERLKILRQNEIRSASPKYTSLSGAVRTVLREEGPRGLLVGFVPTAARQGLAMGVRFVLYDRLKVLIAGEAKPTALQSLAAGMATGTISALINQPIDTAKSRIQAQEKGGAYRGTLHCLRKIAAEEGVLAWYRGSLPRVTRLTIGQGIIFCCYDQISAALQRVISS